MKAPEYIKKWNEKVKGLNGSPDTVGDDHEYEWSYEWEYKGK